MRGRRDLMDAVYAQNRGIAQALEAGDSAIHLRGHHADEGYFMVDPIEMTDDEVAQAFRCLREVLMASAAEKAALMERLDSGEARAAQWAWVR